MRTKGLTRQEIEKRKLVFDTVTAIKSGGDYSRELSAIFDLHSRDETIGYKFSNVAARAMQINMAPLVMLRNGSKRMTPDADDNTKELSRLYRRLDIALALAKVEIAEKTILKIRQIFDKIMVDNPER